MNFIIDYRALYGSITALEFAIDECDNRILEAIAAGDHRTAGAWRMTQKDYQKTLEHIQNAKPQPVLETC